MKKRILGVLDVFKNKIENHPELDSGSPSYLFNKENNFINNNGEAGDPECPQGGLYFMTPKKAFTLIELLVVVLIIGILAAVAVPQYRIAVEKTKVSKEMIYVHHLVQLATEYYLANGAWPTKFSDLGEDLRGCGGNRTGENYLLYCSYRYRVQINKNGQFDMRYCYADLDDTFENRLCQALTGSKNYWSAAGASKNAYNYN